jgi:hypothetical protein
MLAPPVHPIPAENGLRLSGGRSRALAALLCACFAFFAARAVSLERSLGWDESMHAALPAARVQLELAAGEPREAVQAVLECSQYPPAYPLLLAASQSVFGLEESVARATGRVLWALGLFGLYLLGEQLARALARSTSQRGSSERARRPAASSSLPWLLLALGACSPLALAYSGTLFLELPFAVASVYALRSWLASAADGRARSAFGSGAWLALCLFTKWNYGLLLGLACALDLVWEGVSALRARTFAAYARRVLALALVPALACAWWFGWPWPGELALGAQHREALLAFLGGNREAERETAWQIRVMHAAGWLFPTPRALVCAALAAALALGPALRSRARVLVLYLAVPAALILSHPFHLDRFLLPPAVFLWGLAAIGLASLAPRRAALRWAAGALLAAALMLAPARDGEALFQRLLGFSADPAVAAHQRETLRNGRSLRLDRALETGGLLRVEARELHELVWRAAGAHARVAWLGLNSELSPAVIHLELLARGGSPQRFRADAARTRADGKPDMLITHEGLDPGWSRAQLLAWARRFDVVLTTEPLDFKGRGATPFFAHYRNELMADGAYDYERLGAVDIARPVRAPLRVEVFACRSAR